MTIDLRNRQKDLTRTIKSKRNETANDLLESSCAEYVYVTIIYLLIYLQTLSWRLHGGKGGGVYSKRIINGGRLLNELHTLQTF